MTAIVKVEHSQFGLGQIVEIDLESEDALISVQWDNGDRGCYWPDELEFLGIFDTNNETRRIM